MNTAPETGFVPDLDLDGAEPVGIWPAGKPRVLHVDNHCLALVKPFNMPVMPDGSGDPDLHSWARDWIRATYHKPGEVYLGLLHRIDRPAAGLVLLARTSKAAARLSAQFRRRTVVKSYSILVEGCPDVTQGVFEDWLLKDHRRNLVRARASAGGGALAARLSCSLVRRVQARVGSHKLALSEMRVTLETGRPHQIRAQFGSRGWPVAGDLKYGATLALPGRNICLFSRSITYAPVVGSGRRTLEAPLPVEGWLP